ncbi:DUF6884 domain-containing protein [Streptomyces sp. NPDC054871]
MTLLSPTGARILDANENGMVSGHPAAMARLEADTFVIPHVDEGGTHWMTEAGWAALDEWRQKNKGRPSPAASMNIPPKLPGKQHEAVLTAAQRPDQLVAGRDNKAYWAGEPWFRGPTLRAVHQAGYAEIRPEPYDRKRLTYATAPRSLYLTPAGREYARQRGGIDVQRRRVVIIACGEEKLPDPGVNQFGNLKPGYPAGELYIGHYHRSLRLAADALTDRSLIWIFSALHGLVALDRKLMPYDASIDDEDDERVVTADRMAQETARLGLDDAEVIFLGGQKYAARLTPSVPHVLTPLTGGMGMQRGQCSQVSEDAALREAWWKEAASLHDEHAAH